MFDYEPPHPLHPFARLRPLQSAKSSGPPPPSTAPAQPAEPCPSAFPAALLVPALASLTATDGGALRVFPASQLLPGGSALADAPARPLSLGPSEELCVLLLVQQPRLLAGWLQREMDLPYLMPNENNDVYPALASATSDSYNHVGLPDDVLFRLVGGVGVEMPVNASLRLLTAPEGEAAGAGAGASAGWWWHAKSDQPGVTGYTESHTPPRFTAYAGVVGVSALARLRVAAGRGGLGGAGVLPAALVAHVEHTMWSWNSGPRRTLFPCSGENNPGCGAWDDVGQFKSALGPYYNPHAPMWANFSLEGGVSGGYSEGGGGRGGGAVQCATATQGYWTTEHLNGSLALRPGGPYWHPTACDAAAFSNAHISACLRSRFPNSLLLGDSHMRRHFKDLIGRSATIADYYEARIMGPVLTPHAGPPEASEEGRLVEAREVGIGEGMRKASFSMWCHGREEDVDCTCSDLAHGPTDPDPNPLTFLYAGHCLRWGDWGGGAPTAAPFAETKLIWWTGFLFPHWRDDLMAASNVQWDLVVFTLGHWDTAYNALARFEAEVPHLSAALAAAFPPPTLLVFRTPSFFAGDDTWAEKNQGRRWYSHAKIARIKALLTDELLSGELKGRLLVWDVFSVGAGRPIAETKLQSGTCRAGHEKSEFSQLQNMLLLNMLCPSEA